ncbi:MAG TPA: TlpA disulfide reductase family protein [Abditibacteriaceae bacterium]|jgi:peroxiredoxin
MALPMGSQAPDFTLSTLQGKTTQLSQLRGTPVLLNFFRTDCTWCTVEMPKLANAFRRHHDVAVHFLGIASDLDMTLIEGFANQQQLDFPILHDINGETMRAYGIERVPTFIVVDADGSVTRIYEGSSEQLAGIVEQTLMAAARGDELPEYSLVGNGCAP